MPKMPNLPEKEGFPCLATAIPVPLEQLTDSEQLDGSAGSNRAPSHITQQIAAQNDLQAVQAWLAEFEDSPQTHRTYRKEAERLLLWSLIKKRKPLSSLMRDDLREYQHFLEQPEPADQWCGPRRLRHSPDWRPFQGPLSPRSMAQAITIINVLFNYLVEAGYLSGNPLGLIRRKLDKKTLRSTQMTERFFEQELWQLVITYLEQLPQTSGREKANYERKRYLLHLLYIMGPRVSEVAYHTMGSIKKIRERWWWKITGKGGKTHTIPVNPEMMQALGRYRQFYGLSSKPETEEETPLFLSLNGKRRINNNMIYRLTKQIFNGCAQEIEKEHPLFAAKLRKASTHWVRHTAITHQTDAGIELRYIQRNARHESVETTMLYQHVEEDQWHEATAQHGIKRET